MSPEESVAFAIATVAAEYAADSAESRLGALNDDDDDDDAAAADDPDDFGKGGGLRGGGCRQSTSLT
eukprot:2637823-Pleurochrysis_carterae.AAC.1